MNHLAPAARLKGYLHLRTGLKIPLVAQDQRRLRKFCGVAVGIAACTRVRLHGPTVVKHQLALHAAHLGIDNRPVNETKRGGCPADDPVRKRAQQACAGSIAKPILMRIE
jgi:hypothetical protein